MTRLARTLFCYLNPAGRISVINIILQSVLVYGAKKDETGGSETKNAEEEECEAPSQPSES